MNRLDSLPKPALCGCLLGAASQDPSAFFHSPDVDLLEWRLDSCFDGVTLKPGVETFQPLATAARLPVLVTNRPVREGGGFRGGEEQRLEMLHRAVRAGADAVDLEEWLAEDDLRPFRELATPLVLSHHDFAETPERPALRRLLERMAHGRPRVIKIVTLARRPEDNLRVLELIPFARREFEIDVIAFCMGALGRWSRSVSLLMGSPWTYVQMPGALAAAEGQIPASAMRSLLNALLP